MVAGEGLRNFKGAEQAWAHFADRNALDGYLRSLERGRLQDVIGSLEAYENQFRPEHVVPTTIVLFNLLPDLPERQRNMLELDGSFVVGRVTYRLLRSLKDPPAVEAAVRQILPELTSLSSKLALITQIGYRENAGHKLVSEEAATELEKLWRGEVRSASAVQLVQERAAGGILFLTKREADPSEDSIVVHDSPALTLTILRSSRSEVLSQTFGSRGVRRTPRLDWDALVELYGTDKYLSGWRPKRGDFAP